MAVYQIVFEVCHTQPHGGNVKGLPNSLGFILWAHWISAQKFMAIHRIVVGIFPSGPQCNPSSHAASMARKRVAVCFH